MKKYTLILAALFCAVTVLNAQTVESGIPELDRWTQTTESYCSNSLGYPCPQNIDLKGFYEWFLGNGLQMYSLNNAGDPFSGNPATNSTSEFERQIIEWFAPLYGFEKDRVWGLVTMSGTDGNNHGIYFGTKYLVKKTGQRPVMYVSNEAHYSNYRLADLQNLECRLIKSDQYGRMIPEELEKELDPSRPCLIVYAMGSTFKGAIDNQEALNAVLAKFPQMEVYRHIDAALFGGYLPFTDYASMVSRKTQPYNSIAISGHKFFGIDEPCGMFLCEREVYDKQMDVKVEYLNNSMRMINCSRNAVTPLKFWWMLQKHGREGWTKEAGQIVEMSDYLYNELMKIGYPVYRNEHSNTIMFKRPSKELRYKYTLANGSDPVWGELSHVVVMQHVTKELIDQFVDDIKTASK